MRFSRIERHVAFVKTASTQFQIGTQPLSSYQWNVVFHSALWSPGHWKGHLCKGGTRLGPSFMDTATKTWRGEDALIATH